MTDIAFRRTGENEALIMADGETVGYLYRQSAALGGGVSYVAHLDEDPRGFHARAVTSLETLHRPAHRRPHRHDWIRGNVCKRPRRTAVTCERPPRRGGNIGPPVRGV